MTMVTFSNDAQRKNFQVEMAITALQLEVQTGLKMCRIPVMNVLRRHYPDLPRNKKTALKMVERKWPEKELITTICCHGSGRTMASCLLHT